MNKYYLCDGEIFSTLTELSVKVKVPRLRLGTIMKDKIHENVNGFDVDVRVGDIDDIRNDKLLTGIRKRYTDDELKELASGVNPISNTTVFIDPKLSGGSKHKIGCIGDTHIGSIYSSSDYISQVLKFFEDEGCELIAHVGDVVEGVTSRRFGTQVYELSLIGYKAQKEESARIFSQSKLPIYAISGNHDLFFMDTAGADIVEDICNSVDNMTYLGQHEGNIEIDGVQIKLWHGTDGSQYAHSYRLQKLIESLANYELPEIILAGHVHKYCSVYERGIHAVSVGSIQKQSKWMRSKRLPAHVGFSIIEFEILDGAIRNFSTKFYPLEVEEK